MFTIALKPFNMVNGLIFLLQMVEEKLAERSGLQMQTVLMLVSGVAAPSSSR